ncbi:cytochrome c oxidase subunit II [Patulibacter brassicae]|uniref:Cytochrome c oxidase subunit 2 n=1 Tax=Patulibacter brassicae TaxID=1705717 RepID=A0ABU4VGD7_9ACTN|nr:cytochrome c oxidase subunit II [Patulibacter brassicae]MDX8150882.1 cytochrome c oxidase subunit II [Patulibacter brassicae]
MLVLAGPAHAGLLTPESGGSPNADRIHTLYVVALVVGILIFIGTEGALLYAIWKFRARPGAEAEQLHGNTKLEIGWTAGAAVVVLILGIVTFAFLPGIRNPDDSDADGWPIPASYTTAKDANLLPDNGKSLNIEVNGQQYAWRFVYPDGDKDRQNNVYTYEELVVPTGTTVTLDVRSSDVGHAWWIPKLGGKVDALPGYTGHTWFKVPSSALRNDDERRNGRIFTGQCAELCGRNHANMTARVRAVTPEQFTAWLARQQRAITAAGQGAVDYRKKQQQVDEQAAREGEGLEAPARSSAAQPEPESAASNPAP